METDNLPQNPSTTIHDRLLVACESILGFIGLNQRKIEEFIMIVNLVNVLPSFGPIARLQKLTEPLKPIIDAYNNNPDVSTYLHALPEEFIQNFITDAMTKLEWVLHGETADSASHAAVSGE